MACGRLGVRSPSRYGHQHQPVGPGRRDSASAAQLGVVDAEQPGRRVEHPGRVERADQRQEPPGRVGEAGHQPARVGRPASLRRRRPSPDVPIETITSPARAPHARARRPRCRRCPGRAAAPVGGCGRRRLGRAEHARAARPGRARTRARSRSAGTRRSGRRPVAGAAGVAAVGDQLGELRRWDRAGPAPQPPGQPVVRQADRGRPGGVLRLVLGQPAQLGHGEPGHRHAGRRRRPSTAAPPSSAIRSAAAPAERVSFHSSAGRTTSPSSSRHTMPCCCPPTRRRRRRPARRPARSASPSALPPGLRVHLGAVGVAGPALPDQRAGLGVADDHLAGLGRRVDPGDERHRPAQRAPSEVLERELVEPDEAVAPLAGGVGVEVLERGRGRPAGRRSVSPVGQRRLGQLGRPWRRPAPPAPRGRRGTPRPAP